MKDAATILAECIVGQPLAAVNYVVLDWVFIFGNDVCRLSGVNGHTLTRTHAGKTQGM